MVNLPGQEIEPTQRFTSRVENYRRYRPGYPSLVADLICTTCGSASRLRIADIGSGTGIFTRKLLEAGFEVDAVEPNEAMRAVAERDLKGFSQFRSIAAPAEATELPGHYFNAVTAAQAFHWFDREAVQREFSRILQPGGWCFLIWNQRKQLTSPFDRAYEDLLLTLGSAYAGVKNQCEEDIFAPGTFQFTCFDNPQSMNWEELLGRFLSSSYVPTKEDPRHGALVVRLEEIFLRHQENGRVKFEQQTAVYFGRLE